MTRDGDGYKLLAFALIEQALDDLRDRRHPHRSGPARAFVESADFAGWCSLAGLDADAIRDRLAARQP